MEGTRPKKKKTCGNTVTKAATWNSSIYLHITGCPAGLYTLESVLRNSNKKSSQQLICNMEGNNGILASLRFERVTDLWIKYTNQ